jgi:Ca-activated chloride channel homolog
VTINAPEVEQTERREREPLNLAIAMDTSGSMGGESLEYAKRAAAGVVESLGKEDNLTLVSFGSDVHVHLDRLPMESANKSEALASINQLFVAGMTNLSGGWLAAGAILSSQEAVTEDKHGQIILLSDGHANQGLVDPDHLATEAQQLLKRGVYTSCVGVGDGYSSVQLDAIADYGGGSVHDAELPQEIVEVVSGELGGLSEITMRATSLEVTLPYGVTAEDLSGGATTQTGNKLTCHLGAIRGGAERSLVIRLNLSQPATQEGSHSIQGRVLWSPALSDKQGAEEFSVKLKRSKSEPSAAKKEDVAKVVSAWQAGLTRRSTEMNREQRFSQIGGLLETELSWADAYTQGHPALRKALMRMRNLLERAMSPMHERSRKNMHMMMKKGIRAEPELRSKFSHMNLAQDFAAAEAEIDRLLRED